MQILGKVPGRDSIFVDNQQKFGGFNMKGMLAVMRKISRFTFHLYNFDIRVSSPMTDLLVRTLNINFTYGALMFTIVSVFFIISCIVIN